MLNSHDQKRTDMYSVTMEKFDSEIARKCLEVMARNRPVVQYRVEQYASDMRNGHWSLSHQGIAFNCRHEMIDGQHRCHAVIRADAVIPMTITYNVPDDAMISIDTHATRDVAASLFIAGNDNVNKRKVAIGNAVRRGPLNTTRKPGRHAMGEFLRHYSDGIEFAFNLPGHKQKGLCTSPVLGCFARAYYHESPIVLRDMYEMMVTGSPCAGLGPIQTAIQLAKSLESAGVNGRPASVECYHKTQRMIRGFIDGEKLARCYSTDRDLFPLLSPNQARERARSVRESLCDF